MFLYIQYLIMIYIANLFGLNLIADLKTQKKVSSEQLVQKFLANLKIICEKGSIENYFNLYCNYKKNFYNISKLTGKKQIELFNLYKIIRKYSLNAKINYIYFNNLGCRLIKIFEESKDKNVILYIQNIKDEANQNYKYIKSKIKHLFKEIEKGKLFEFNLNIKDIVKRYKDYNSKLLALLQENKKIQILKFDDFVGLLYIRFVKKVCFKYKEHLGGNYIIDFNFIESLENLVTDILKKTQVRLNLPISKEQLDYIFEFTQGEHFIKKLYIYLKRNCNLTIDISTQAFSYYVTDNILWL